MDNLRKCLIAGVTAFVVLVCAEVGATLATAPFVGASYEWPRNKTTFHLWPQYTSPRPRHPDERLVIVIANSQGYAQEVDGTETYAARLERLLDEADPDHTYTVANWSIPGVHSPEMIVLAARAIEHRPDAVLYVTFSQNFRDERTSRAFIASKNDIEHLAYLPQVRRHLSPWFIERFKVSKTGMWLAAHSRLVQMHETFVAMVRAKNFQRTTYIVEAKPWSEFGSQLLEEIGRVFHQSLPQTPVFVVSMPLNPTRFTAASWPNVGELDRQARARLGRHAGITMLDATNLIEPKDFCSATHMTAEGHDRFARWLLPYVASSLNSPQNSRWASVTQPEAP